MTVIVQDSFNRANATTLGSADTGQVWQSLNGSIGIISNQAYAAAPNADQDTQMYVESGVSNVKISLTFLTLGANEEEIYFRIVDASNYLRIARYQGDLYLQKCVAGAITTVTTVARYNAGDTVLISANGSAVIVYYNGVQKISTTITNFTTATKHGFGFWSSPTARVDNFIVEDFNTGATGTDGATIFDLKQTLFRDAATANDSKQAIYSDSLINSDLKQSLYNDSLINADVLTKFYQDGAIVGDTKQTVYNDNSTLFDSKQVFFADGSTAFDMLQEFFSDGVIGSIPFDVRIVLYNDNSIANDLKQSFYANGSTANDTNQAFYTVGTFATDTKQTIYQDGNIKGDVKTVIFADSAQINDLMQSFFQDGFIDFDTLQKISDGDPILAVIRLRGKQVLEVNLVGQQQTGIRLKGLIQ